LAFLGPSTDGFIAPACFASASMAFAKALISLGSRGPIRLSRKRRWGSMADLMLVNGRTVKRGGKLLAIDLKRVRARALASQEYILGGDEQDGGRTAWSWTGKAPLAENRH
jgi:hypothetical protein